MPNTYDTGYYFMSGWNANSGTFYPDPNKTAASPPANTQGLTTVKAECPFNSGGRDGVIRSASFSRKPTGSSTIQIADFLTGLDFAFEAVMGPYAPEHLNGIAWFIKDGFRVIVSANTNWSISYQVLVAEEEV